MALSIRFAHHDDGPDLASIYAPHVEAAATSFELHAPDAAEMGRRVVDLLQTHPWLVAESEGEVIGYSYASPHRPRPGYRWSTEVSVYVSPDRHRGRVGRALYTALFELLVLQHYVTAYAGITLPNPASVAFHEAMGFREIGTYQHIGHKLGAWHDVVWYSRLLRPLPRQPEEPIPLVSLRKAGMVPGYLA
ncbi:MAG: GNAT family N-acetyltransferase [Gemmatimonadales bacterium]|nr:GNAT family N-acetyltransferase [Gemmatimonadales bacterium]